MYDYLNFGHYPHEFAVLPLWEKAAVMAFIDLDIKNRKAEASKARGRK